MGFYVRVTKMAWDVMSGVTKTAWDVLSGVANLCGMFCPGCKKMAWDVLSRDVLSGSPGSRWLAGWLAGGWAGGRVGGWRDDGRTDMHFYCHKNRDAPCKERGTDKSPLGQKPTRTKAHWTISHWKKVHCLIWQGGQNPTSLEK